MDSDGTSAPAVCNNHLHRFEAKAGTGLCAECIELRDFGPRNREAAQPEPTQPKRPYVVEEPADVSPLDFVSLEDLSKRPESEVRWLVNGLFMLGGLSMMIAPPKAGKSTLARCLATAVANGAGSWLGRPCASGPVLHLALEEPLGAVMGHYRAIHADLARVFMLDQKPPDPSARAALLDAALTKHKPALCIIDPLFRWLRITDGNAYSEVSAGFDPYVALAREHDCALLFVHHARKSGGSQGNEALGSVALTGSVDSWMSIKRQGAQRFFNCEGRGVLVDDTLLQMDGDGWVTTNGDKGAVEDAQDIGKIADHLHSERGWVKRSNLVSAINMRESKLISKLKAMQAKGAVLKRGSGTRNDPHRYALPAYKDSDVSNPQPALPWAEGLETQ